MRRQMYMFTEWLLKGDAKATYNLAVLDIGICIVDNFNKVVAEMTKYEILVYAFCYLQRHLIKSRSMKLHCFVSRLQSNAY